MLAGAAQPGADEEEGHHADRGGGRPVRGGSEPVATSVDCPRGGQRADASAEQDRAEDFRLSWPLTAQRDRDDQGEEQLGGQQRLGQ